jgi:hypothetical protein
MKNYAKQEFLKQPAAKKPLARIREKTSRARGGLPGKVNVQNNIVFNEDLPYMFAGAMMLITLFGLMALS